MVPRSVVVLCMAGGWLAAQQTPVSVTGWYNGDWRPAIPGSANWYQSSQQYGRTFDDFVVPESGWTIVGLFSNNSMSPDGVTEAAWEIRAGVSPGNGGTVVAAGQNAATLTQGGLVGNGVYTYKVQVDGLWVQLRPGRYWLSVSPVTMQRQTFLCATLGANAIGQPAGTNGGAVYDSAGAAAFTAVSVAGQGGSSSDFSLGVLVAGAGITRDDAWRYNVTTLSQQMAALHSIPFPGIGLAAFNAAAADLGARLPALSEAQARTAIQELVASIGDPHTDIEWPSPKPFLFLPLSFYWFDDGVYVTAAAAPYQSLLGGKVTRVGGHDIEDALRQLTPLIAHDNESWLKAVAVSRLTNTDFLSGTGVADSTAQVAIEVERPVGAADKKRTAAEASRPGHAPASLASMSVTALAQEQFPAMLPAYRGPLPLWQQHTDRHYWATAIDGGATVYFQYNSCTEDPLEASADFLAGLDQLLAQSTVKRLIVDMRNNSGGSATILDPWIARLKSTRFNSPGRLYVMVGRATFSAAMEATDLLHDGTAAIFVGEPTGGKPQFLLRRGDFALPFFGLRVSYSNGVEKANDPGPSLIPDMPIRVSFADYMNGVDAALDAILKLPAI